MAEELSFTATIRTNKVGSDAEFEVQVDRMDWEQMTTVERDQFVLGVAIEEGIVDFNYEDPADD